MSRSFTQQNHFESYFATCVLQLSVKLQIELENAGKIIQRLKILIATYMVIQRAKIPILPIKVSSTLRSKLEYEKNEKIKKKISSCYFYLGIMHQISLTFNGN